MITSRWDARRAERHIFPDIAPKWSRGFTKPTQAPKVRFTGIEYQKPVYITPYLLSGFSQSNFLTSGGTAYQTEMDYVTEAGLDIKYLITGNMNLDSTLNIDFAQVEAGYEMPNSRQLRTSVTGRAGTFYDGKQYTVKFSPAWNPSKHFELSADAELNYLQFPDRDKSEYLHIFRVLSIAALNIYLSLQLLSQYNHLTKQFGTNARFRYNFSEGHDF